MKPTTAVWITVAFLAFMAGVMSLTLQSAEVECEVCLRFGNEEVCRLGRGPDQAEALRAAQESACGGNVSGMAELIECRGRAPTRAQCGGG